MHTMRTERQEKFCAPLPLCRVRLYWEPIKTISDRKAANRNRRAAGNRHLGQVCVAHGVSLLRVQRV